MLILNIARKCYDIIDSNKIGFKFFYVIIAVKYITQTQTAVFHLL